MPVWLQITGAVLGVLTALMTLVGLPLWWASAQFASNRVMLKQIIELLNKNEVDVEKVGVALEAHREDDRRDIGGIKDDVGEVRVHLTRLESRLT